MQKILIFNGLMTSLGLVADLTGVIAYNSLTVALIGFSLGIVDTLSFAWIIRHKTTHDCQKKAKTEVKN